MWLTISERFTVVEFPFLSNNTPAHHLRRSPPQDFPCFLNARHVLTKALTPAAFKRLRDSMRMTEWKGKIVE
jgi:hypothetical protein